MITIQKSVAFLYNDNVLSEREIKETPIYNHIAISLSNEVRYLCSENHKILMIETEYDTTK